MPVTNLGALGTSKVQENSSARNKSCLVRCISKHGLLPGRGAAGGRSGTTAAIHFLWLACHCEARRPWRMRCLTADDPRPERGDSGGPARTLHIRPNSKLRRSEFSLGKQRKRNSTEHRLPPEGRPSRLVIPRRAFLYPTGGSFFFFIFAFFIL